MYKIIKCGSNDYETLAEIWERSVRATHGFLTEQDIAEIKSALTKDYFPAVDLYAIVVDGTIKGFTGLCDKKIEMLFIDSDSFGNGLGSKLIDFAIQTGAKTVDVNEQNPDALKFYLSKGFRIASRDETDDAGRPFPILHMALLS